MTDALNLDDIRLKSVESMTDAEKDFLVENKAELTKEELAAFTEFIPADDTAGDEGEDDEEGEDEGDDKDKQPAFKTVEEANKWLADKKKEWETEEAKKEADAKAEADRKAKEGEVPEYFKAGYKPKDWNQFTHDFIPILVNNLVKNTEFSAGIRDALGQQTVAERERVDKINTEFDTELAAMHKEGLVPDPATDEGKKVDKMLTTIGAMLGLGSMRDAYTAAQNLGKTTGVDFLKGGKPVADDGAGGGEGGEGDDKKSDMATQKKKAGLIGKGGSGAPAKKGEKNYKETHGRSLDDIMADATAKLEE